MQIRTKLGYIIMLMVMLIVIVSVAFMYGLNDTKRQYQTMIDRNYEAMFILKEIQLRYKGQSHNERGFLLTGSLEFKDELLRKSAEIDQFIIRLKGIATTEEEQKNLDRIEESHNTYTKLNLQVIDTYLAGDKDEAGELAMTKNRKLRKSLDSTYDDFVMLNEEALENVKLEVEEHTEKLNHIMWFVVVLALGMGSAAGVTLSKYHKLLEEVIDERTAELKDANADLQAKNDAIMESIDYAERLQRAILPPLPQRLGLMAEKCFVVWQPKDIVGGDMYWCRGDDHYVLVAVADCTGHGVPGALMSMTLGSILDGLPRQLQEQNPSSLLYRIHAKLKETLGQDKKDSLANDGADIALCLLDKVNKKIFFAGAKLSLFVENDGQVKEYKGTRHSVGYSWNKEVVFSDCEIDYIPGSVVYMTTDGLLDQNAEEGKGGLGRKGFVSLLENIAGKPLAEQCQRVEEMISARLSRVEQRDDITVMGFEIR